MGILQNPHCLCSAEIHGPLHFVRIRLFSFIISKLLVLFPQIKQYRPLIYGYFWDINVVLSNSRDLADLESLPTNDKNIILQRVMYATCLKEDEKLKRRPRAIRIGNNIYFEHGKYRIIGSVDTNIHRPRDVNKIKEFIDIIETGWKANDARMSKTVARDKRTIKEILIKNYPKNKK